MAKAETEPQGKATFGDASTESNRFGANRLLSDEDIMSLGWSVREEIAATRDAYRTVGWGETVVVESPTGAIAIFPEEKEEVEINQIYIIPTRQPRS